MSIKTQARSLMMRHHQSVVNREKSMLMRTSAEIGVNVDSQYHNQIQGKTPNDFSDVYDRSRAAMS
ncbi:hypothetical protein Xen7305DRAFT_00030040 [Xenococcus sp. PCC 7305]|uniref:hypothetical protein n=1 Tax=Xenococcus sp. PCC 7305 TaxID=102125 RepID=UPI0002AC5F5F|nr:hypothetical protein [Xenococcus sp. PCC 7305]ELS03283.1 hypothetical protein Xen7305DRAFT_00030040 [Xenococcus sp. PCC 7305]